MVVITSQLCRELIRCFKYWNSWRKRRESFANAVECANEEISKRMTFLATRNERYHGWGA